MKNEVDEKELLNLSSAANGRPQRPEARAGPFARYAKATFRRIDGSISAFRARISRRFKNGRLRRGCRTRR